MRPFTRRVNSKPEMNSYKHTQFSRALYPECCFSIPPITILLENSHSQHCDFPVVPGGNDWAHLQHGRVWTPVHLPHAISESSMTSQETISFDRHHRKIHDLTISFFSRKDSNVCWLVFFQKITEGKISVSSVRRKQKYYYYLACYLAHFFSKWQKQLYKELWNLKPFPFGIYNKW